jgi:hypothetical protein
MYAGNPEASAFVAINRDGSQTKAPLEHDIVRPRDDPSFADQRHSASHCGPAPRYRDRVAPRRYFMNGATLPAMAAISCSVSGSSRNDAHSLAGVSFGGPAPSEP